MEYITRATHIWAEENPPAIYESRLRYSVPVNVWIGVIDRQLTGSLFFNAPYIQISYKIFFAESSS